MRIGRTFNAIRLANALARREDAQVTVFLMGLRKTPFQGCAVIVQPPSRARRRCVVQECIVSGMGAVTSSTGGGPWRRGLDSARVRGCGLQPVPEAREVLGHLQEPAVPYDRPGGTSGLTSCTKPMTPGVDRTRTLAQ
jgi:hypothetical protein